MLLKVVIIDDNPLIIQSLEETIDWHSLSCEVVGKSTSGETGRRIIKKLMPEIIISDIRMPGIDGLDMIEFIKPVVPNAKVIVISGYEDFEYANRAIKIGVSDYILKPINNDELSKTIKKVADEIFDHQNENKLKTTIIKENLEHSKNLEHMKYLKKLSVLSNVLNYSEYDNNEIKRIFEREKIHFKAFLVIAVTVRDSQEENSGILERINDLKLKIEDIEIFSLLAGSYVVCFVFFIKKIPRHPKNIAIKLYEQLKIAYSNAEIYITSTGIYTEASDITSAFEEARLLLRKVLFEGFEGKVVFNTELPYSLNSQNFNIAYYNKLIGDLCKNIKYATSEETPEIIRSLIKKLVNDANYNIDLIRLVLSELCMSLTNKVHANNNLIGDLFSNDVILQIVNKDNINELEETVICFIKDIYSIGALTGSYSPLTKSVLKRLYSSPEEFHTLKSVAKYFKVNHSYLSTLIKKETGKNFKNHVVSSKLEHAKILLMDPRNRIEEISWTIGYKNYSNFYKVFKEVEGISPKEYREGLRKDTKLISNQPKNYFMGGINNGRIKNVYS